MHSRFSVLSVTDMHEVKYQVEIVDTFLPYFVERNKQIMELCDIETR